MAAQGWGWCVLEALDKSSCCLSERGTSTARNLDWL